MWCSLVLPANPDRIPSCEATRRGWSFALSLAALTALCLHSHEDQYEPPDFALWPCLLRLSPPELIYLRPPRSFCTLRLWTFSIQDSHPGLPRSVLPRKASLTKQPLSTFAFADSRRWMQSADDRLFRNPPWLAPLRSSDRGLLCQTSSLLLPAATACAPATFGLSASLVWPSFHLAVNRLEYHLSTIPAIHCRCCFQRLFRITPASASGRSVTQCPFAMA